MNAVSFGSRSSDSSVANLCCDWDRILQLLRNGGACGDLECLPFGLGDGTAGSETELQTAVVGREKNVDLPLSIRSSNYYANLLKRSAVQDTPKRALRNLQRFLEDNPDGVWENSWVRFPCKFLSPYARSVLDHDLTADKSDAASGPRGDIDRFLVKDISGESLLRVPVSYLLRLALVDVVGSQRRLPSAVHRTVQQMADHFLNDNMSPETCSFYVVADRQPGSLGKSLAKETSIRFLLTQLLVMYANQQFRLDERGQHSVVYFGSHPPVRQQELSERISDTFYRELLTSPCLSGWDSGEEKQEYMRLCHTVLSRSQLNAAAKVRDAGLIASSLVLLPSLSDVSLANNGIHVSLGSKRLSALLSDRTSRFGPAEEKYLGDLVTKIVEHFLPLFVGTYSAAPYRVDFADFHAERVLGFLPHELDFTHLRMLWRRWKKKARISVFGQPIMPSGYETFDRFLAFMLRLRGDFVPDFRLTDYLVAPLSTDESPALNGELGNQERLKRDLTHMGVYDPSMAFYSLYRQRLFGSMGYSGFEGRYYSLCEGLEDDFGRATDLQRLVTALAFKYVADGEVAHLHIPDDPTTESERRQAFFGAAIGIPTFFVRQDTPNLFLKRILRSTSQTRSSHRYAGHLRVKQKAYRIALLETLRRDAASLIEMLGLEETILDLEHRLREPERHTVAAKVTSAILNDLGVRSPMAVSAATFNRAAERYYRNRLRLRHLREGFQFLEEDWRGVEIGRSIPIRELVGLGLRHRDVVGLIRSIKAEVLAGDVSIERLRTLINVLLITIWHNGNLTSVAASGCQTGTSSTEGEIDLALPEEGGSRALVAAPVCQS